LIREKFPQSLMVKAILPVEMILEEFALTSESVFFAKPPNVPLLYLTNDSHNSRRFTVTRCYDWNWKHDRRFILLDKFFQTSCKSRSFGWPPWFSCVFPPRKINDPKFKSIQEPLDYPQQKRQVREEKASAFFATDRDGAKSVSQKDII
jgi:hypothetical protein